MNTQPRSLAAATAICRRRSQRSPPLTPLPAAADALQRPSSTFTLYLACLARPATATLKKPSISWPKSTTQTPTRCEQQPPPRCLASQCQHRKFPPMPAAAAAVCRNPLVRCLPMHARPGMTCPCVCAGGSSGSQEVSGGAAGVRHPARLPKAPGVLGTLGGRAAAAAAAAAVAAA